LFFFPVQHTSQYPDEKKQSHAFIQMYNAFLVQDYQRQSTNEGVRQRATEHARESNGLKTNAVEWNAQKDSTENTRSLGYICEARLTIQPANF